jgi:hypothetical protein
VVLPHKIHVSSGGEYNGETYIWCECVTPEGENPVQRFGSTVPHIFDGLFDDGEYSGMGGGTEFSGGGGLPALLAFLKEHRQIEKESVHEQGND